jgi:hypothetical protein
MKKPPAGTGGSKGGADYLLVERLTAFLVADWTVATFFSTLS